MPAAATARPTRSAPPVSSRRMRKISLAQLRHVLADLRADFDDRLVELALDLLAQRGRAGREQLGDVRAQLPGLRIDDLELLFDADGEPVRHGGMILQSSVVSRQSVDSRQSAVGSQSVVGSQAVAFQSPSTDGAVVVNGVFDGPSKASSNR